MMKKILAIAALFSLAGSGLMGCATKSYVDKRVKETLAPSIGLVKTQMEGSIGELQRSVAEVREEVSTSKGDIRELKDAVAEQKTLVNEAIARAQDSGKAKGKLLYEAILSEEAVSFGFDQSKLSDDAKAAVDNFAHVLIRDNKNVYLEIQGHTDNIGSEKYNLKLGQDRADAVMRYLHEKHDLPLNRINTYSYGASKPVGPNDSDTNRAKNRRVVILVME